jgi:hypothetical protein
MAESAESNRPTEVKPRSTWSSPRKPRQWTLLNPLTKSTHTCGQPLVKDTVKPGLTIDVGECRPELLPRSPNFSKTLQNLPLWKLSILLRDTTFMLIGISNFERKRVKNLVNCQQLLCTETWRHSKMARCSCKIRWEKHLWAFVKVVEGSEIYNVCIHCSVHFSSNFWRKTQSNRRWLAKFWPGQCPDTLERRRPKRARAARGPPPRRPDPPCAVPTAPSEVGSTPRPSKFACMPHGVPVLAAIRARCCPPVGSAPSLSCTPAEVDAQS